MVTLPQKAYPQETTADASPSDLLSSISLLASVIERQPRAADAVERCRVRKHAIQFAVNAAEAAERQIAELKRHVADLERLAITDELTGLLNRRGFEAELHRALAAARRYQEAGVLIYVDLDGFKPINDTYGHAAGDEVLRRMARLLGENVRPTDHVGRLGGDEFAILLTRTTREDGLKRAEALDELLNSIMVDWQGSTIALRASFGVQPYGSLADGRTLLRLADHSMYRSKRVRAAVIEGRAVA